MQEFRKARIQREIAEILSGTDQLPQALPGPTNPQGRYIGVAFLFMILGVLMGQSVAMKAMETDSEGSYEYIRLGYPEFQPVGLTETAFPELPEIEIIYDPNVKSEARVAI